MRGVRARQFLRPFLQRRLGAGAETPKGAKRDLELVLAQRRLLIARLLKDEQALELRVVALLHQADDLPLQRIEHRKRPRLGDGDFLSLRLVALARVARCGERARLALLRCRMA